MGGTLIILVCSLFMNAGAGMSISDDHAQANLIVMNTVIAAASSGLLICFLNQY
jgi:ammonia channel protein AmtB